MIAGAFSVIKPYRDIELIFEIRSDFAGRGVMKGVQMLYLDRPARGIVGFRLGFRSILLATAMSATAGVALAQAPAQTDTPSPPPSAPPETAAPKSSGNSAENPAGVASNATVGEVVVTALKRNTTVENTPMAITAITGDQLVAAGVVNITDVARLAPGV